MIFQVPQGCPVGKLLSEKCLRGLRCKYYCVGYLPAVVLYSNNDYICRSQLHQLSLEWRHCIDKLSFNTVFLNSQDRDPGYGSLACNWNKHFLSEYHSSDLEGIVGTLAVAVYDDDDDDKCGELGTKLNSIKFCTFPKTWIINSDCSHGVVMVVVRAGVFIFVVVFAATVAAFIFSSFYCCCYCCSWCRIIVETDFLGTHFDVADIDVVFLVSITTVLLFLS